MGSSFKSVDLFGSGPHRFRVLKQGQLVVSDFAIGGFSGATSYLGLVELRVVVRGRLVAESESALWTLRDAIGAELLDPPLPGELVDGHGRSWEDMSLIRYEEEDRTDRGRVWSVGYACEFIRFENYPQ